MGGEGGLHGGCHVCSERPEHTRARKHLHMPYTRQRFIGMFRRRGQARGMHKGLLENIGALHIYVHVQMCVGVFWAVTCNIHHPHCQRHGEISQDSPHTLSRISLSCGACKIFWTAGAHVPWGSCLVTHDSLIWSYWLDQCTIGRGSVELQHPTHFRGSLWCFTHLHETNVCVDSAAGKGGGCGSVICFLM